MSWRLEWMNAQFSRWQPGLFFPHPSCSNPQSGPFPSGFFDLFLWLRGDGDATASTDRSVPTAGLVVRFQSANQDVPSRLSRMDVNVANGPGPKGAGHLFQTVNHRADHGARATRDGPSRKHSLQRTGSGFSAAELRCHMADQMLNIGVSLHVKPVDIDGSRDGHLRQIMTH